MRRAGAHSPLLLRAPARPQPHVSLLILCAGALSFALAQTAAIPAIPPMAREFDAPQVDVAWTLTANLVAAAVMTPIVGRLGDMFGKRRVLVIALLVFAAGSVIAALGQRLDVVIAGRAVQGVGAGIFPLCFGIVRDEFPARQVAVSLGVVSAILGLGGALGFIVGGLLVDHSHWTWIFWLAAASALAAAAFTQVLIPESPVRSPARVDVRGAAVLAVGLVALLLGISQAGRWGWQHGGTLALMAAGVAVLVGWWFLERRTTDPLVDVATLAERPVLLTNLATLAIGFGLFGSFILIPQLAQAPVGSGYGFGASATQAGLLLVPGCVAMLLASPLAGVLAERRGNHVPLIVGAAMTATGLGLLTVAHGSEALVVAWSLPTLTGLGLGLAAMPNLLVAAVGPLRTGEATGVNALIRAIGAAVGSQVTATILTGTAAGVHGLPAGGGYTTSFAVCAVVVLAAAVAGLALPRDGAHGGRMPTPRRAARARIRARGARP